MRRPPSIPREAGARATRCLSKAGSGKGIVLTSGLLMLTCRDFVEFLDDYLSGSLTEDRRGSFNAHLAQCPSCVAYMRSYQASIEMGRAVLSRSEEPVSKDVPEELVRAILEARKRT